MTVLASARMGRWQEQGVRVDESILDADGASKAVNAVLPIVSAGTRCEVVRFMSGKQSDLSQTTINELAGAVRGYLRID